MLSSVCELEETSTKSWSSSEGIFAEFFGILIEATTRGKFEVIRWYLTEVFERARHPHMNNIIPPSVVFHYALVIAIRHGHNAIVEEIIQNLSEKSWGSTSLERVLDSVHDGRQYSGKPTLLQLAVELHQHQIFGVLLKYGANIHNRINTDPIYYQTSRISFHQIVNDESSMDAPTILDTAIAHGAL